MALSQAWAVEGGTSPASVGRMIAWCATNGKTGVVRAPNLKVTALSVPGGGVNVAPGGALAANGFAAAIPTQTYAAVNDATVQVPIAPTGASGGRTDYLILKFINPLFDGSQMPADPATAPFCEFVTVLSITGLAYPFVPLAKIVIPASTGTITAAMITDLRKVANPSRDSEAFYLPATAQDPQQDLTSTATTGEIFPGTRLAMQTITIPEGATRIRIKCTMEGVQYPTGKNPFGRYWVEWGDTIGPSVKEIATDTWRFDSPGGNVMRTNWVMAAEQAIPVKYRGTTTAMWFKARYDSTGTNAAGVRLDAFGGAKWDVEYLERAQDA